ncbi:hypothetical protein SAMN05720354_1413 [Nitrosospira sp. Nsp1]|nr:hypothetical protein SAMN05720354_1413 [Nitrosospira sp. Nsp1]
MALCIFDFLKGNGIAIYGRLFNEIREKTK